MKTLVVYDSYFGNTEKIAQEIGKAIGDDVPVKRPGDVEADELPDLDYLIVGSPTRAFRPSDAIKDFLKKIPSGGLKGVKVAAFDTRIAKEDTTNPVLRFMVNIFGYAAKPIADGLARKGGEPVGEPAGFIVLGTEGPLKDGELERAAAWAERIGVEIRRVQVRSMRNKWASCSTNGTLTLSSDLLRLPHDLVEVVVCHELVHLKIPHHGRGFRALMGCYIPDWQQRERNLASWVVQSSHWDDASQSRQIT